jgi:multidrug transporter EmrE-like cation transporter
MQTTSDAAQASFLILMTLALATLSTVFFLLTVAEIPAGVLFAVVVGIAAIRPVLRRRGVDMSLTAPVLAVPRAQQVQLRR